MSEYVVAQASVLIVPSLDGFQKELKAELKAIQAELRRNALEVDVKAKGIPKMLGEIELAKQAAEEDPIKIRVDTVDVIKRLTEIRHKYEDLGRDFKKALVLDVKVAGMTLLPQLAQGLAAANASMVQLVQTGLVLPGVLSGVASSILTVVTGLGGVSEAFKEYRDAQKNAAQESLKARNAAKNIDNAYRDLGRTFKDAQRNLEDLNAQLRDAPLDEAEAIIAVAEARAEAADKANKSGLQQQKDALALAKAENQLVDVRMRNSRLVQDTAEANAKGVAGADSVREATDRLAKAQDEANTQTTKLSDSLKKISPNAQAFVEAVTGMDSQWMQFKNSVQDRLFAGLDQEVKTLATTTLPLLTTQFGAIADALNNNVKTALQVFQRSDNQGLLDNILGNTADAQGRMSKAIEPFLDAFLKLSEVGSGFLPRLVDGLGQLAQRFENFVKVADSDGSLDKWIEGGIEAFNQLGNSIINIGSILNSVTEAFTGSGGKTMLELLEQGSKRLADFLNTQEGQERLVAFFEKTRDELAKWEPFLSQLPGLFSNVAQAGSEFTEKFLPLLTTLGKLIADHPALVSAAIQAYLGWKTVSPIIKGVSKLMDSEMVGVLKNVAEKAKIAGGAIGYGMTGGGLSGALGGLSGIVSTGGVLMGGLTALTAYLGYQYVQAQNEAAQKANDHANALARIGTQVDSVTGKLTQSGLIDQLKQLGEYTNNQLTGDPTFDLIAQAQQYGIATPDQIANSLRPGDAGQAAFDNLQAANQKIIREALLNTENGYYNTNKELLQARGISLDDIVAAASGDAAAAQKLADASVGFNISDVLQGYNGILPGTDIPGLGDKAMAAANLNRGLIENRRNTAAESARVGTATQALGGTAQIKPNTPWAPLGVDGVVPLPDGSGGIAISVKTNMADIETRYPELFKLISDKGGSIQADAVGATITFRNPAVALEYANIERRASGGLIRGPGSGTSDSILTALSNGEYVINAKATQKHLPLLESINGGKLSGYSVGGPIKRDPVFDGGDPSSDPGLPALGKWVSGLFGGGDSAPAPAAPVAPPAVQKSSGPLLGGSFSAPMQPAPKAPAGPISDWLFQMPAAEKPTSLMGTAGSASFNSDPTSGGLGDLLGANDSMNTSPVAPVQAPGRNSDPITGSPLASVFSPKPILDAAAANSAKPSDVAPKPNPAPVSGPTVHSGSKQLPGPSASYTGPPLPAPPLSIGGASGGPRFDPGKGWVDSSGNPTSAPPLTSDLVNPGLTAPTQPVPTTTSPVQGTGPSSAPIYVPQSAPGGATSVAPSAAVVQQLKDFAVWAEKLPYDWGGFGPGQDQFGEALKDGNLGGFDCSGLVLAAANIATGRPWNYGGRTGSVSGQPSFYTGNQGIELAARGFQPGLGGPGTLTIGWSDTHTGMTLPDGTNIDAQNSQNGIVLGEGSRGANGFPNVMHLPIGAALPAGFTSPSNMPMAATPGGVYLPQFTNIPGQIMGGGADSGSGGGMRLPTPEEYVKYVTESWQNTLQNLVRNAGQIATNFIGSFFGLDLSGITGLANSVIGGIDLPTDKGGQQGDGAGLPGDPGVAGILGLVQDGSGSQAQGSGQFQYDPNKDANQWRPAVRDALSKVAAQYGITNLKAWEDDIVGQIAFESRGNPNASNLNDSNGQGGTQQVFGLGQFLPSTFAAHNVTRGDISDPIAQIYAMIDYLASPRYGVIPDGGVNWKGFGWRNNQGYAVGGKISGPGNGKSDSIIARVSNGEYIVRSDAARKHMGLLNAINYGGLPAFAEGGIVNPLFPQNPPPPPPVTTPPPPPSPVPPPPGGPQADAAAGMPTAPTPVTDNAGPGDAESTALKDVGAALGGLGGAIGGVTDGAQAPAGGNAEGDPRSALQAAPQNLDHNKPAVSQGIQAAAGAIGSAVSTAMSVAAAAGTFGAAGGAGAAASGPVQSLIQAGGTAVVGAVNILSSLGVGNITPSSTTAGAYGTPLVPQANGQQPYSGPQVVNNWNGGVHTSNNDEFYKLQQRRELQAASPYLPMR